MIQRKLPVTFVARSAAALILAAVVPMLIAFPLAAMSPAASASTDPGPKVTREIKGSLPTRDGQRLHLVTELGNVRVHIGSSGKVEYHITLGTDASDPDSQKLLKDFELAAHPTPDGVSLRGEISANGCTGHLWVTI